jgi:predicted RNA-binding protein with PUA-like domain
MTKQYWLMKTEPDTFGIADLEQRKIEPWTGVRSTFARFYMRKMSVGDDVLFYHSSCNPPGVAGLARVHRTGVVDETQFDPASPYFEPKATREQPIWDCVDVEYVATLPQLVPLPVLRAQKKLAKMVLMRQGRLSVQPVTKAEFEHIVALAAKPPKGKPADERPRPARAARTRRRKS